MLSKRAEKLLKWMSKQESATKVSDIEQNCKDFYTSALKDLAKHGFIAYRFDEDFSGWDYCSITDLGKAYLEELSRKRVKSVGEWLAIGISLAALFGVSAIKEAACKALEIIRSLIS